MADVVDPAEGQDNPDRPDWLPENFNSPEDLAKSYRELQGRFTQESQARSALEENFAEVMSRLDEMQAQQVQPSQQYDPNDQLARLSEQFGVEPEYLNAAIAISQNAMTLAQQEAQAQVNPQLNKAIANLRENNLLAASDDLRARYPDWDQKVDKVKDYLEQNSYLVSDDDLLSRSTLVERLDTAYKTVSFDEMISGNGGQQVDLAAIQLAAKLNGQTASGASSRPDPVADEKAAWDAIRNAKPTNYYDKR